jgi:YaiO family outer membrane protein
VKKLIFISCLIIIIGLSSVCLAETTELIPGPFSVQTPTTSLTPLVANPAPAEVKKTVHVETGGSYTDVDNDQWKSLDLRWMYSGFKKFTPFGSMSTLARKNGSQRVYGLGSYINVNPKFYMIAGASGAPVRDPNVIYYPRLRLDLSGFISVPFVKGLVFSTGISHFPKQNGGGSDILSVGGIYYGKIIFIGSLNYNISRPGNITSLSGQGGFMYGTQGKYWLGGGYTMGRVAYQLQLETPYDVRYQSRGINLSYSRWLDKNWGINNRLDYGELVVGSSRLIGITTSLFFDF